MEVINVVHKVFNLELNMAKNSFVLSFNSSFGTREFGFKLVKVVAKSGTVQNFLNHTNSGRVSSLHCFKPEKEGSRDVIRGGV